MTTVLIVRLTSSLILLGGAILIHQYLPNTQFLNFVVVAMLAFFVSDGPFYGIQKSTDRLDSEWAHAVVLILVVLQIVAVSVGAILLLIAGIRIL
jgi:hypothetical protein